VAGFVTDTVEEELAYTMEQLAVPVDVMRKRVEETLDLLRYAISVAALHELSGGQQQRVAIGAYSRPIRILVSMSRPQHWTHRREEVGAIPAWYTTGGHRRAGQHRLERWWSTPIVS